MKKIKILVILGICMMFGGNAYASGKHYYGHNDRHAQYQKNNRHNGHRYKEVKTVKHVPAKYKHHNKSRSVQKTVVVHHHGKPKYHHNRTAETAALVGLGIITTAAIVNAVL